MKNLWRRIGNRNRKSSSKSSSDENATQSKPQEPELARNKLVLLGNPAKRFDWGDVRRANWEVLGEGMVGTTYKVDLEDGTTTVVVKSINDVVLSAMDFRDKVVALGAMDHENLLPPRGYFDIKGEKFLLYDYMPMGSLSNQLHGYRGSVGTHLSWEVRLSIALGAARAIDHLHAERRPNDHHGNIKSSNVLLTPSYEARVSDYGLASLTSSALTGGADPRMADVYGFGVLLLELLTGKLPSQLPLGEEGVDLPVWVQSVARKVWTAQVFYEVEEALFELLEVAIRCVSPDPSERPWMSDIRKKIGDVLGNELVLLGNPAKRFGWEDVKRANWELLGEGTVGTTYKVDLGDGTTKMVVKRLKDMVLSAKDFRDAVEALGAMDHENLLPLRGYLYRKDQKLLLYDYMPMGSLSSQLHGYSESGWTYLSWEVRLSIALGAARAIEHLHAQDVHHGNIKSSNVLLTPSFQAQVSHYGLPHLTKPDPKASANPSKADVYGFGLLLLELVTGQLPTWTHQNEVGQVVDLPAWVNYVVHTMGTAEVLDPTLLRWYNHGEKGVIVLLQVASSCVFSNLHERPQLSEVRRKIEELCSPGGRDGDSQPDKVSQVTKDPSSWLIHSAHLDKDLQLDQFGELNNDVYAREPPDGVLEISERVYGENVQFQECKEGLAAVTVTNLEITSGGDCASSSAVSSGSMEATKALIHNSAQIPEMTMLQEEKPCQLDGLTSSTSMPSRYDYDVFLSFRGLDTRSGITDFLYTSLIDAGIHTFRDDEELRIGEEISPELLKSINHSEISIPILSKGYAFSKWCLNELVQMVECRKSRRQKIMPIFYDVTPSEVRHQTGSYEDAFASHEKQFDNKVISKWKAALKEVGDLKGWDVDSMNARCEGGLVKLVVQKVIAELKRAPLLVTDCLVGIEHHVKEINKMVCGDTEDIQIVGIHGMGGVGKTTLAKIIYNQLSHRFEDCCFLSNVRETSQLKGIECLQNQLISDILKKRWSDISNVEEGINIIKERLCGKKVLVLLDDVDQMTHWDALIGKPVWFGLGSRIIITSRNRDIVNVPDVCYPYELMSMNFNQSIQLFCKHAFGRDYPSDDYVAFSTEVVKTTGGLPLALEAIGKLLPRRSKVVWDVILKKLKQVPLNEVKRKLKICYDALDDSQKHIFLDIACLFTGFDQRIVLHSWKDSNLFPEEGLEVLQKMSLIKISEDNKLWMHEQLRCLGRDIVGRECDEERKEQTRLWNHEEGFDMVMETKGIINIEALCRKLDPQLLYYFGKEEAKRLSTLRYPEVRVLSNDFPDNLQNTTLMLSKLRWLSWHHFPLEVKIINFSMINIVILHLVDCPNLIDVQSIEGFASLAILKLVEIPLLERFPDLSNLKKLDELYLGHCHSLIEVQSIEGLGNLTTLKLVDIPLLKRLPDLSNLKKLTELHLRYCHDLTEIRSFAGLENLMMLKLGELPLLERLPNLSNLKKLAQLDLQRCHNLVKIQGRLESLEDLCIQGCRSLDEVLEPASSFKKLKSLRIHDCEKLNLDRIWVSKFEVSDIVYENSTCRLLSKMGICVCQLGKQFFLPSLPRRK